MAAGSDGQSPRLYQMFRCALPSILLRSGCLGLWSWWASRAATDSWGGARREDGELPEMQRQEL